MNRGMRRAFRRDARHRKSINKKHPTRSQVMKPSNDKEAITLIMDGLREKQVYPARTHDGEEVLFTTNTEAVVKAVTAVDEASVAVILPNGTESFIWFVLGNDPEEVACDYGVVLSEYLDPIIEPWWK